MKALIESLVEFMKLGAALRNTLPDEIRAASESSWDASLVQRIRADVGRYARFASRIAIVLAVSIFVPLVVVINYLVRHAPYEPYGLGYPLFGAWVIVVGGLAIWLLCPVIPIARCLQKLPEATCRELTGPLWMNLDALNILVSAGLFCYVFPRWSNPTVLPILILLEVLWLFGPLVFLLMRKDVLFVRVRLRQFVVLLAGALITVLSPVPVSHFQWWARREAADVMRPVKQREMTAEWTTLQWFSQEGAPNVWYSGDGARGYRLFSAPGFDPETNEELRPVTDKATKALIVSSFLEQRAAQGKKAEAERHRLAAETKTKEEHEKLERERMLTENKAQKAREKEELRDKLIRDYVCSGVTGDEGKRHATALIVLNSRQEVDTALAERISKSLTAAGLPNDRSVFTPAFIASPDFHDCIAGKISQDRLFHIEDYAARLLVIRVVTAFGRTQPVDSVEMSAADTEWTIQTISPADGRVEHSFKIKERGVGFKEGDAERNAVERAEGQLVNLVPSLAPPR